MQIPDRTSSFIIGIDPSVLSLLHNLSWLASEGYRQTKRWGLIDQ